MATSSQSNLKRGLLQALAGAIFGAGLSYFGIRAALTSGHFEPLPWFASLLLGLFLAVFLHELGHVLAGISQGFTLYLFIVGPLRVSRQAGKLKIGLNTSLNLAGGLAACLPSDNHDLARRMAIMTAGGPLASVLTGLLLSLIGGTYFFLAAIISFAIGLATLLPWKSGQFNSDGARLQMYFTNPRAMSRWANTAALSGLCFSDVNPAQWPVKLVEDVRAAVDDSYDGVSASMTLYYHAIGTGDELRAGRHLDHFLTNQHEYPVPFRPALCLEGAYYEAAIRNNPIEANRWLNQSNGGVMIETYTRLRAEAAVKQAEGQPEQAAAQARQALALLARQPSNTMTQIEHHLLQSILTTAEQR